MFKPVFIGDDDNKGKLCLCIEIDVFELLNEADLFEILLVVYQNFEEVFSCLEAAVIELELTVQCDEVAGKNVLF